MLLDTTWQQDEAPCAAFAMVLLLPLLLCIILSHARSSCVSCRGERLTLLLLAVLAQLHLQLSTHTIATPMMTTAMDATTGAEKRLRMYSSSTMHTNGMISSLAICKAGKHVLKGKEEVMYVVLAA
jgi:hypothetical protein